MSFLAFIGVMLVWVCLNDDWGDGCSCSCDHEAREYTREEREHGLHLRDR